MLLKYSQHIESNHCKPINSVIITCLKLITKLNHSDSKTDIAWLKNFKQPNTTHHQAPFGAPNGPVTKLGTGWVATTVPSSR